MPIAKSAEISKPQINIDSQPSDGVMHEYDGVPVDLLRFYGVSLGEATSGENKKLREIYDIVNDGLEERTIGNVMQHLSNLDLKMGATPIGERRLDRIWAYLKLTHNIRELDKRRRAYER